MENSNIMAIVGWGASNTVLSSKRVALWDD